MARPQSSSLGTHAWQRSTGRCRVNNLIDPVDGRSDAFDVFLGHIYGPLMEGGDGIRCVSVSLWKTGSLAVRQSGPAELEKPGTSVRNRVEQLTRLPNGLVRKCVDEVTLNEPVRSTKRA
jgi:hypothetical protein